MTVFTHALSTNNYGTQKFIVATSAENGTHTTLSSALASASSGDTIVLRDSVTEDVSLKAGVNIVAWGGSELTPTITITGNLTFSTAGTVSISGIRLQTNSAAFLTVAGSAVTIVHIENCYLNCTNATGISYSTSNTSSKIYIKNCLGDVGTTGIAIFAHSSTGSLNFEHANITNTGGSSTASTASAGILNIAYAHISTPITTSSTAGLTFDYTAIDTSAQNAISFTCGGSSASAVNFNRFVSGSASAISIGTGSTLVLTDCSVSSTNTNAITGAGTFSGGAITFVGSSFGNNTTNKTNLPICSTQGTWVPNIQINGSSTGITYSTQTGTYIQIGNLVFISANIVLSSKGASTGNVTISNLPFATGTITAGNQSISISDFAGFTLALYTSLGIVFNTSSIVANFITSGQGQAPGNVTNTFVSNSFAVVFCGSYSTL